MNYSSRFFLYAPLALLLLIGAACGVYWRQAAGKLEQRLDALQTHEAMPGVTVRYGARSISGFPFNLDVVFSDFRVSVETGHGPFVWRTEKFALHALTYGADKTIFEAAGNQSFAWTDTDGHEHVLPFDTGSLHASAIRNAGGLSRFDLELIAFGSPALTAAQIEFHVRHAADGKSLDVFVSGNGVHLSPRLRGAFGDELKLVKLQGSISQAAAFDDLRGGKSDWRKAVEAWRNKPGRLRVEPLEFHWLNGPDLVGKGALSLDDGRRPEGLIDFKVTGMPDWLARNPQMEPDGFAAALRDRASKAGSDEGGRMGAVFGIQDSVMYLGDDPIGTATPLY
ncbi:MAG TPA: DUF2125 domain-containing protein [Rhizomicrobium sp.]|nr:DUF2125 domain-containing protein [Rhizomicrobium sp.]